MKSRVLCFLMALVCSTSAHARTWTSTDGKTLSASYVNATDTDVTLKRDSDGKEFVLPLERLSLADRAVIEDLRKKGGAGSSVAATGIFADQITGEWAKLEFRSLKVRFYGGASLDGKKTYPLVLFLHGKGSGGDDNEKQLGGPPKSFVTAENYRSRPCFVLAPQCPNDALGWNGDYLDDVIKLVETASKALPVDPKRRYITGLSMGGYGTWAAIAKEPKLFAAAIPVCGGGNPANARALKKIAIWAFHGDADDVVPVTQTRTMVEALEKAHANVKYTEYPGVKHDAWTPTYGDAKVHEWLFEQAQ